MAPPAGDGLPTPISAIFDSLKQTRAAVAPHPAGGAAPPPRRAARKGVPSPFVEDPLSRTRRRRTTANLQQALTAMKKGARLRKIPRTRLIGTSRFILLRLTPDETGAPFSLSPHTQRRGRLTDAVLAPGLTWFSKRLKQEMLVPLSQIEGVRASPTKEARWCFTVTFEPDAAAPAGSSGEEEGQGPPRQPLSELKLVCQNMDEYNCWVVGIQALVAVSRPRPGPSASAELGPLESGLSRPSAADGGPAAPGDRSRELLAAAGPASGGDVAPRSARASERSAKLSQTLPPYLLTQELGKLVHGFGRALNPQDVIQNTLHGLVVIGKKSLKVSEKVIPLRQRIEPQDPGAGETEHYYVPADGEDPSDRSETEASTQGGGFMAHIMGDVYVWGENLNEIAGNQIIPTLLVGQSSIDAHDIACGQDHLGIIDGLGNVYTWGAGDRGQLGHGVPIAPKKPHAVKWLQNGLQMRQVAATANGTAAVTSDRDLYLWGEVTLDIDTAGDASPRGAAKGPEAAGTQEKKIHWLPTRVPRAMLGGSRVRQVSCGPFTTALTTVEGALYSWGQGLFGALGHGDLATVLKPRLVESFRGVQAVQVSCGVWHTAAVVLAPRSVRERGSESDAQLPSALQSQGWLYTWGDGAYGKLGHGNDVTYLQPERVKSLILFSIKHVATGCHHTCCTTATGSLWTWGRPSEGRLGRTVKEQDYRRPGIVEALNSMKIVEVSCGTDHTAALVETSRAPGLPGNLGFRRTGRFVYTWGKGAGGRCGHGDEQDVPFPKEIKALATKQVLQVSCGYAFTAAIAELQVSSNKGGVDNLCSACQLPAARFYKKAKVCARCGAQFCRTCASERKHLVKLRPLISHTPGDIGKAPKVCKACEKVLKEAEKEAAVTVQARSTSASNTHAIVSVPNLKSEIEVRLSPGAKERKFTRVPSQRPLAGLPAAAKASSSHVRKLEQELQVAQENIKRLQGKLDELSAGAANGGEGEENP